MLLHVFINEDDQVVATAPAGLVPPSGSKIMAGVWSPVPGEKPLRCYEVDEKEHLGLEVRLRSATELHQAIEAVLQRRRDLKEVHFPL
jgi:hypothetical protein